MRIVYHGNAEGRSKAVRNLLTRQLQLFSVLYLSQISCCVDRTRFYINPRSFVARTRFYIYPRSVVAWTCFYIYPRSVVAWARFYSHPRSVVAWTCFYIYPRSVVAWTCFYIFVSQVSCCMDPFLYICIPGQLLHGPVFIFIYPVFLLVFACLDLLTFSAKEHNRVTSLTNPIFCA